MNNGMAKIARKRNWKEIAESIYLINKNNLKEQWKSYLIIAAGVPIGFIVSIIALLR